MLSRRTALTLGVLLLVSPLFGVIVAEMIGYREPLDLVAEELNSRGKAIAITATDPPLFSVFGR